MPFACCCHVRRPLLAEVGVVLHRGRIVEQGPADEIFATPREPYTQELLQAALLGDPAPDPSLATDRPER